MSFSPLNARHSFRTPETALGSRSGGGAVGVGHVPALDSGGLALADLALDVLNDGFETPVREPRRSACVQLDRQKSQTSDQIQIHRAQDENSSVGSRWGGSVGLTHGRQYIESGAAISLQPDGLEHNSPPSHTRQWQRSAIGVGGRIALGASG
jgi:hypothetical protein